MNSFWFFFFFKERATKVGVKRCFAALCNSHQCRKHFTQQLFSSYTSRSAQNTRQPVLLQQLKAAQRCCGISSRHPWQTRSTVLLIQGIYCWREKCRLKMSEERWWPSAGAANLLPPHFSLRNFTAGGRRCWRRRHAAQLQLCGKGPKRW